MKVLVLFVVPEQPCAKTTFWDFSRICAIADMSFAWPGRY
jgi:hypothetical protein